MYLSVAGPDSMGTVFRIVLAEAIKVSHNYQSHFAGTTKSREIELSHETTAENSGRVEAAVMWRCGSFQTRAAATAKRRSPTVDNREVRIIRTLPKLTSDTAFWKRFCLRATSTVNKPPIAELYSSVFDRGRIKVLWTASLQEFVVIMNPNTHEQRNSLQWALAT